MSEHHSNLCTCQLAFEAAASDTRRITGPIRPHGSLRTLAERGFSRLLEAIPAFLGLGDDAISIDSDHAGQPKLFHAGSALSKCFITLDQLEQLCQERPGKYLVEGLLPTDEVHVAVGDSGLGKTPWAYQLGPMCGCWQTISRPSGQARPGSLLRPRKWPGVDTWLGPFDLRISRNRGLSLRFPDPARRR